MNEKLTPAANAISQRFGAQVSEFRGETTLLVPAEHNQAALRTLRDEYQFDMLIAETAVDYWPQLEPRFNVLYLLYSFSLNANINVRVPLNGNDPHLPTAEGVYPNANWYEREIWDLFGITFDGHSDPRRIMMPMEWVGHPLRKDYPLGYEEPQFTFNASEVDAKKPYAKD